MIQLLSVIQPDYQDSFRKIIRKCIGRSNKQYDELII
jgi:hypothetical protein